MIYLLIYAMVIGAIVFIREINQRSNLDRFLVAERRVGGWIGSMSIAASWIWAPAIFISSQVGYTWGFSGLLWFSLPNMVALIIFAPLATKVRRSLPKGFNYIQYLEGGSPSFARVQLLLQLTMQVVIFAIQLVAGAEMLARLTGASYGWMVIGMALTPLAYTAFSGLRTSVFTDALQYLIIGISSIALLVFFPGPVNTPDPRPFQPMQLPLLFNFGISSALGLIVAIFADHQQWQRAFAIKEGAINATFFRAAIFHGLVTVSLGTLGSLIYAAQFNPERLELVGFEYVSKVYPAMFVPVFVVMALCALVSTLDSALCAFSSLAMKELAVDGMSLRQGRLWMIVLAVTGAALALLHPSLLTLWFAGSTIRLSSFAPTVLSIVTDRRPSRIYTIAIISALLCGGSTFAGGVFTGNAILRTAGMALTLCLSLLILGVSELLRRYRRGGSATSQVTRGV